MSVKNENVLGMGRSANCLGQLPTDLFFLSLSFVCCIHVVQKSTVVVHDQICVFVFFFCVIDIG